MIATKFLDLKIFLVGALLIVVARIGWALISGKIRMRKGVRSRAETPVQFWAAVRLETCSLIFLLLPVTFVVWKLPNPLPVWFKIAMAFEAVAIVLFFAFHLIAANRRSKRADAEFAKSEFADLITYRKPE